jgi:hypothetical protein
MAITKLDIIKDAYSQGLATGVTTTPTADDIDVAVNRLEAMASELQEAYGVRANYNFENNPEANSDSGLEPWMKQAFATNLMLRLCQDFGTEPAMTLLSAARASMSKLMGTLAKKQLTYYSARMPMGSGQPIYNRWMNHYGSPQIEPVTNNTLTVSLDDLRTLTVDFNGLLKPSELLAEVEITKQSNGVDVVEYVVADNKLMITLLFTRVNGQFVNYKATGDEGTVINRSMLFNVQPSQASEITND